MALTWNGENILVRKIILEQMLNMIHTHMHTNTHNHTHTTQTHMPARTTQRNTHRMLMVDSSGKLNWN